MGRKLRKLQPIVATRTTCSIEEWPLLRQNTSFQLVVYSHLVAKVPRLQWMFMHMLCTLFLLLCRRIFHTIGSWKDTRTAEHCYSYLCRIQKAFKLNKVWDGCSWPNLTTDGLVLPFKQVSSSQELVPHHIMLFQFYYGTIRKQKKTIDISYKLDHWQLLKYKTSWWVSHSYIYMFKRSKVCLYLSQPT